MRYSTTILLLISLSLGLQAQNKNSFRIKSQIAPASCMFLSGIADGLNQVVQFRYVSFKKAFPGINDNWWNPKYSYNNKYKGGIKSNGERFLGSSTVFVAVTDSYHFSRFLEHFFMVGAISLNIGQTKKKWYIYALESATYLLIYRASFSLTYNSFK